MKIKEVEECVGLTRSNIRFYEREGLLSPDRNENNNYRDYTDEDVKRIKKIKTLRMLGVSTADIRRLYAEELTMEEVMRTCLVRLEDEERELRELRKICENLMVQNADIHSWDGETTQPSKHLWNNRLKEVFAQDTVNEPITRKQLNKHIGKMLLGGYFLNAVFTLLLWPLFQKYQGFMGNGVEAMYREFLRSGYLEYSKHHLYVFLLISICVLLANTCTIFAYSTENMKRQVLIFYISCLTLAPFLLGLSKMYEDYYIGIRKLSVYKIELFTGLQLSVFWLLIMLYVLILYFLFERWEERNLRMWHVFAISMSCTFVDTVIAYVWTNQILVPAVVFLVMTFYIGINWMTVNQEKKQYCKLDAAVTPLMIMNPLGLFIHRL